VLVFREQGVRDQLQTETSLRQMQVIGDQKVCFRCTVDYKIKEQTFWNTNIGE